MTQAGFGRKLNHVAGLGMGTAVGATDVAAIVEWYAAIGLAAEVDLCPFADPSAVRALAGHGFVLDAFSHAYARPLTDADLTPPPVLGVCVAPARAEDEAAFLTVSVAGFAAQTPPRPVPLLDLLARIAWRRGDTRLFFARVQGVVAGTAGVALIETSAARVALLYLAGALPAYRGRGVQTALLRARLAAARAAGFDLAGLTARPMNVSARNAERAGFGVAYTRPPG